jgi:hypothetical protein
MLRRQCLDAVERVGELHVDRLFDPQRAVIVERGDPLRRRDEVGRSFPGHIGDEGDPGHIGDEGDDRLFRWALVPRGQGIGLGGGGRDPGRDQGHGAKPGQANSHVCLPFQYSFNALTRAQRQEVGTAIPAEIRAVAPIRAALVRMDHGRGLLPVCSENAQSLVMR